MHMPSPLAAFDITPGGAATAVDITAPRTAKTWRWVHLDFADPHLADWLHAQIDPLIANALIAAETRPRADVIGDGMIVMLRGVNLNPGADPFDMVALRMWITHDTIISVRKRKLKAVEALRLGALAGKAPGSPPAFLAALADALAHRIEAISLKLEDDVDALEEHSLDTKVDISNDCLPLRQSIIKLRRFVGPQREALEDLALNADGHLPHADAVRIREVANRTARTVEALDASRDRLSAIQDHLDGQTAMKLGRNSYVLSVMAAIFLPLGFLTGLFGVNVAGMPGTETIWAFAALTALSTVIGIVLFAVFRWRGWL